MIDAQLVLDINNVGGGCGERESFYKIKDFIIPSVLANTTSDPIRFFLGTFTSLVYYKCYCESTDYEITFYDKAECIGFSQCLNRTSINKFDSLCFLDGSSFGSIINKDYPQQPYIYCIIENKAGVETNIIQIEFILAQV